MELDFGGINYPSLLLLPFFISSQKPSLLRPDLARDVRGVEAYIRRPQRSRDEFLGLPVDLPAVLLLQGLHHLLLVGQGQVFYIADEEVPVVGKLAKVLLGDIAVVGQLNGPSLAVIRRPEAELCHLEHCLFLGLGYVKKCLWSGLDLLHLAVAGIDDHPVLRLVGPAHECPAVNYRTWLNDHWNAEPVYAGSDGRCLLGVCSPGHAARAYL